MLYFIHGIQAPHIFSSILFCRLKAFQTTFGQFFGEQLQKTARKTREFLAWLDKGHFVLASRKNKGRYVRDTSAPAAPIMSHVPERPQAQASNLTANKNTEV